MDSGDLLNTKALYFYLETARSQAIFRILRPHDIIINFFLRPIIFSRVIHSLGIEYSGCRQAGQERIGFGIIAMAHSRCTLCEHGNI